MLKFSHACLPGDSTREDMAGVVGSLSAVSVPLEAEVFLKLLDGLQSMLNSSYQSMRTQ